MTQEEKSKNTILEGSVKIVCICAHCGHHDHNEATVQIDFLNSKIIFFCPKCKKLNEMTIKPPTAGGYPRIGRMG